MRDYTLFPRRQTSLEKLKTDSWDVLISAYNSSPRVNALWRALDAKARIWAVHREYGYENSELPNDGEIVVSTGVDEAAFILQLLDTVKSRCGRTLIDARIAIDITGFMRPELVFLVRALRNEQVDRVDFFYSEPSRYKRKGWTEFSKGNVQDVRQVIGCEGIHDIETSGDLLVIGTGYDDASMASVAEHKPHARKALIFGLPSLAPDMYQENVWRVSRAAESIGYGFSSAPAIHYAPANDPFVTATVVSDLINKARDRDNVRNVYLSPLGTKVQAFGFALYFSAECSMGGNTSILLPIVERYERETSEGVGRIWRYTIPFRSL